jgi:N-methylhydantoinase A/oxoprolinase/acetone carboxylase beta subunit
MKTTAPSYNLGIDTGGTFTDGVLFDPQTRQVVMSTKELTTHYDLKICISQILERLIAGDPARISLVSLSTTLATNAIAEGKRKPIALLLLGYDSELVYKFDFHQQFGTKNYFFIQVRHDLNVIEQFPLDQAEVKRIAVEIQGKVDTFAISSYGGPANSEHEERAAEIVSDLTARPVVQAHHCQVSWIRSGGLIQPA